VFVFFCVKITRRKFLFYLYPLIFAFWVNLHGAFVMGLAFLALAFTGEILNRIFFSRESFTTGELVHLGVVCVLSGAATLLNPYGIKYLLSIYLGVISPGPYDKFILAYASLWPALKNTTISFFNDGLTAWIMTVMILTVFSLSIHEFVKKRSCDFALLIVSLALYCKGMEIGRASYFFPIAFFFIFFYLLIHRLILKNFPGRITIFSLLIFLFFFISTPYLNLRYAADNKWFGAGLDSFAPVKEVAFLKKYHPEGPIFNDYVIGGYLVWALYPDYNVFIDPRGGLYATQVFPDYMEFTTKHVTIDDIHRFTKKYPFKVAIIHYRNLSLIFDFLSAGDEWHLLYFEKHAAILIHKSLLPAIQSEMSKEIKDQKNFFDILNNPLRFRDVKDPEVLINVFNFYVKMNPEAGRCIYDIFKENVSDYYEMKTEYLQRMDTEIRLKEQALQNKTK
ncbi:MAG: hypothetical protein ABSC11_15325, partial [Smithella sp.]